MAKTDAVLGTAHYISPEQAQGKELSPTSDIYSLGIVLYEAATGQLPFDGPDAVSVAMMQVNETPTPPRDINPAIDPNFEAIIMKAMSKDSTQRFSTAREMRRCLNDFLAGRPVNVGVGDAAVAPALADETAVMSDGVRTDRTSVMTTPMGGKQGASGAAGQRTYVDATAKKQGMSGKRRALIAVAAVLVVAVIAGLSYFLLSSGLSGGSVEVPDLAGKTLEEATASIEEVGFELGTVEYQNSDTVESGKVISQTPRAGTHQEKGTKVTLVVSQGVEQVEVPDLSNMTATEARSALQAAGLKYDAGTAEHSDTVDENHVLRQNPAAGQKVAKGSTVTYYLSAGAEKVSVPDVVGQLEGEATTTLQNAGFTVMVDYQPSSAVAEGCVISQTPGANEKAKRKSAVALIVSSGAQYFNASAYGCRRKPQRSKRAVPSRSTSRRTPVMRFPQ